MIRINTDANIPWVKQIIFVHFIPLISHPVIHILSKLLSDAKTLLLFGYLVLFMYSSNMLVMLVPLLLHFSFSYKVVHGIEAVHCYYV